MNLKKIIKEHRTTFPRALIEGAIITLIAYSLGVLFVDMIGYPYKIIGLSLLPVTFIIKYILNKYWVYKPKNSSKNQEI